MTVYAKNLVAGLAGLALTCAAAMTVTGFPLRVALAQEQGQGQGQGQGQEAGATALPQLSDFPRPPGLAIPLGDLEADPFADTANEEQAPPAPADVEAEIRKRAFDAAITGLLPLNPDEIRDLLSRFDKVQQAVETPIYPYPKPEIVAQTLSLDPGSTPPEIKVAAGHVTNINILDSSGARFPVLDITWAGDFDVVQPGKDGNIIKITPTSDFAYGNMAVTLPGLTTPVLFILKTHRDSVHYRFDATIPAVGPFTETPLIQQGGMTLSAGGDNTLGAVLDGVVPDSAQKLFVNGTDSRTTAYRVAGMTYLRTPLTLLSPGWSKSVKSADGMNVYALANAPVLLLSDQGQMVRARLDEEKDDAE